MAEIFELHRFRHSKRRVSFDKRELSLIMGLYSRRVSAGIWRDYAIDHLEGMAVFSVFRHSFDQPLLAIVKYAGRPGRPADFVLAQGPRRLARSRALSDILDQVDARLAPLPA